MRGLPPFPPLALAAVAALAALAALACEPAATPSAGGPGAELAAAEGEGEGGEPPAEPAVEPEACVARFEALKAGPGAPLALADPALRASLFGRVRGAPSFFVREPRAAAPPRGAEPARGAKVDGVRFRQLRKKLKASPRVLRALALREGYVYATDPLEALDLVTSLRIADLFDEPEVWLQRGAQTSRLVRAAGAKGEASYRYAEGPRAGRDADLLFLDRLAASPAELEVPLHRDVGAEGEAWGFDRVRLVAISGLDGAAELRFGGRWVRAVLGSEGPALRVRCLAEGADVRANVLTWRAGRETERRAKRALFDAVTRQSDEGLRFDRPEGDPPPPDSDGQLRAAWQAAFFGGYTTFFHEGRGYPVLTPRGEPYPPQVCVDFVLESFERASGTHFSVEGGPSRRVGRLDFDAYHPPNRRSVLALEAFAQEHPELFAASRLPEPDRVPFYQRERFFKYLLDHADDFAPGDIVAIQGYKRDDKIHQHAILLESVDPLTGFPFGLADQMRRPRRRTWEAIMAEAPRRSLLFRLRPTDLVWSTLDAAAAPASRPAERGAAERAPLRSAERSAAERAPLRPEERGAAEDAREQAFERARLALAEARRVGAVEIEHRPQPAGAEHGHDELGPGRAVTRDVPRKGRDVRHQNRALAARRRAANAPLEGDTQAPHAALVGPHGQEPLADAPVEAAPVALRERLPEQARERRLDSHRVGLTLEGGRDLGQGLFEPREALGLGQERAARHRLEQDAFAHEREG